MNGPRHCHYCSLPVRERRGRRRDSKSDGPVFCCYGCRFADAVIRKTGEGAGPRGLLNALGLSIFLTMNVMMFSLALYSQDVYGRDSLGTSPLAVHLHSLLRYLSLLLATPVFVLLGFPILANSLDQLRQRILSTDGLVVLGVAAAFVYSYVSTLTGEGGIYYETACVILILLTFGRYLEAQGKVQASAAVRRLESLLPDSVEIRRDGKTLMARRDEIRVADEVLVHAGHRIPVDGKILRGSAHIDEQFVSGESVPVEKGPGATVHAGSINTDGLLEISVTAVGPATTLARLVNLVEEARRSRGRFERITERVTAAFVPIVVVLAVAGGVFHAGHTSPAAGLMAGLSVLLISCPCALGIATPLAVWSALGRAAEHGILFRTGEALERLAEIRCVAFDKTGTLTTGTAAVAEVHFDREFECVETNLGALAALASASGHPYSRAISRRWASDVNRHAAIDDIRVLSGLGMEARYTDAALRFGSHRIIEQFGLTVDPMLRDALDNAVCRGDAVVCASFGSKLVAVMALTEQLRADAAETVNDLRALGHATVVLTGDHSGRTKFVANALALPVFSGLRPDEKAKELHDLRRRFGPVAMVGDGLNDAPALATADVGIAMGCGADLTRETAQICLLSSRLGAVVAAFQLSRTAVSTIKLNLFWAFFYNMIGIGLALSGKLNPMFAAIAMTLSSLFVVGNSLRPGRMPRVDSAVEQHDRELGESPEAVAVPSPLHG